MADSNNDTNIFPISLGAAIGNPMAGTESVSEYEKVVKSMPILENLTDEASQVVYSTTKAVQLLTADPYIKKLINTAISLPPAQDLEVEALFQPQTQAPSEQYIASYYARVSHSITVTYPLAVSPNYNNITTDTVANPVVSNQVLLIGYEMGHAADRVLASSDKNNNLQLAIDLTDSEAASLYVMASVAKNVLKEPGSTPITLGTGTTSITIDQALDPQQALDYIWNHTSFAADYGRDHGVDLTGKEPTNWTLPFDAVDTVPGAPLKPLKTSQTVGRLLLGSSQGTSSFGTDKTPNNGDIDYHPLPPITPNEPPPLVDWNFGLGQPGPTILPIQPIFPNGLPPGVPNNLNPYGPELNVNGVLISGIDANSSVISTTDALANNDLFVALGSSSGTISELAALALEGDDGSITLIGAGNTLSDGSVSQDGYQQLASLDTGGTGIINSAAPTYAQLGVILSNGEFESLTAAGITSINTAQTGSTGYVGSGAFTGSDGGTGIIMDYGNASHYEGDILANIQAVFQTAPSIVMAQSAQNFSQSETQPNYDPLVIDLGGNGFSFTGADNGKYIQTSASSLFSIETSWISPGSGDGVLFYDPTNSGALSSPVQLFGTQFVLSDGSEAADGFAALASLDSNSDGVINSSDSAFSNIKIQKDDGTIETLAAAGITSLSLSHTAAGPGNYDGAEQVSTANYGRSDSSVGTIAEFNLASDPMFSHLADPVPETPTVAALPDAPGYGTVASLHQAMLLDSTGTLQNLVQNFVNSSNSSEQETLLRQIMVQWTGSENIDPLDSADAHIDGQTLNIVEQFMAKNFVSNRGTEVGSTPAKFLDSTYQSLANMTYGQLMFQSHLSSLANEIIITSDPSSGSTSLDLSNVATSIEASLTANQSTGEKLLGQFVRSLKGLGLDQESNFQDFHNTFVALNPDYEWVMDSASFTNQIVSTSAAGTSNNINGNGLPVAIKAGAGNDSLYGLGAESVLYGGSGNDTFSGGVVKDLIVAGTGNGMVHAGTGDETIVYNQGSGNLTVSEYSSFGAEAFDVSQNGDTLDFGPGIAFNDLTFVPEGQDLKIEISGSSSEINLLGALGTGNTKNVSNFNFADGSFLSLDDIKQYDILTVNLSTQTSYAAPNRNLTINGSDTTNANIITGNGNDTISSGNGNQTIFTGSGSDITTLGSGNDIVHLGDSVQQVQFGSGSDTVDGGSVANTYVYSSTSGNATITRAGGDDSIVFGTGIAQNDVVFGTSGLDLTITFNDKASEIVLKNQLADSGATGGLSFQFDDGSSLSWPDVQSTFETTGTSGNDSIDLSSTSAPAIINGLTGNDSVLAGSANDTIIFGSGNDTIDGGAGSNIYVDSFGGTGTNVINEDNPALTSGETDTLVLGTTESNSDFYSFSNAPNDLWIDAVDIKGELDPSNTHVISEFKFASGVTLSLNDVLASTSSYYEVGGIGVTNFLPPPLDTEGLWPESNNDIYLPANAGNQNFSIELGSSSLPDSRGYELEVGGLLISTPSHLSAGFVLTSGPNLDLNIYAPDTNVSIDITNELLAGDFAKVGSFEGVLDPFLVEPIDAPPGTAIDGYHSVLNDFLRTFAVNVSNTQNGYTVDRTQSIANENITNSGNNVFILAGEGNDILTSAGDNTTFVSFNTGNATIHSTTGSDLIDLRAGGNSTVVLGLANDTVYDGSGDTILQVVDGTANSYIRELGTNIANPGNVTIEFANDITQNDVTFEGTGNDLLIHVSNGAQTETIDLESWLSPTGTKNVDSLHFSGNNTSITTLLQDEPLIVQVTQNDAIADDHFAIGATHYEVSGNNTRLNVGGRANTTDVTGSNDLIFLPTDTNYTNQVNIAASALNNTINLGYGSLAISVAAGSGQTKIGEFADQYMFSNDTLSFGTGIDKNAITVTGTGYDLTLHTNDSSNDSVTLLNALNPTQTNGTKSFTFSDSSSLTLNDLLSTGAVFEEPSNFFTVGDASWTFNKTVNSSGSLQKIYAGHGNDVLNLAGNDSTVYGNNGTVNLDLTGTNATITSGTGAMDFSFNQGNGAVVINEGTQYGASNDHITFGAGISPSDLRLTYDQNSPTDMTIGFDNSTDTIRINNEINASSGYKKVADFTFANDAVLTYSDLLQQEFYFTENSNNAGFNHYGSYSENITISGNNDSIQLGSGNDTVLLSGNDDTLVEIPGTTGTLNVTVSGANATIHAAAGAGNYTLDSGMGNVLLYEPGGTPSANDQINFGAGISSTDMRLSYDDSGTNMIVGFANSNDTVTINNELISSSAKRISQFSFADGTVLSYNDLMQQEYYFKVNTDNASITHFGTFSENLTVNGKNDVVSLGYGNDTVTVNGDNAVLVDSYYSNGTLNLTDNAKNLHTYAGSGASTFNLNAGMGNVLLTEQGGTSTITDQIVFGAGITESNLRLTYAEGTDDLIVGFANSNDTVTVSNELNSSNGKKVSSIAFANNSVLSYNDILAQEYYFTESANNSNITHYGNFNENIKVNGTNDTMQLANGNDTITINGTNDTLWSGQGSNTFSVNSGFGDATIKQQYGSSYGSDHVIFGSGISLNDLVLSYDDNADLIIGFDNSNDQLTLQHELSSGYKGVADFAFADGGDTTALADLRFDVAVAGNNASQTDQYTSYDENLTVTGDNDTLYLSSGANNIDFAGSNATLYDGAGIENYNFSTLSGSNIIDENHSPSVSGTSDSLSFSGLALNDLTMSSTDEDLTFTDGSGNSVTLQNELNSSGAKIVNSFSFSDHSDLSLAQLTENGIPVNNSTDYAAIYRNFSIFNENISTTGYDQFLVAGSGNDTITSTGDSFILEPGTGNETINISGSNDEITGNSGRVTLTSTGVHAYIMGGSGTNDTFTISGDDSTFSAGTGSAVINDSGANDTIDLGSGTVTLNANGSGTNIWAGSGSTVINDSGANDNISLGSGTVTLNVNDSGTIIYAGNGHETVNLYVDDFSFSGSSAIETLTAHGNNDTLSAGSNNTTMAASGTNDTLWAGWRTSLIQDSGTNDVIHVGTATNIEVDLSGTGTTVAAGYGTESIHLNNDNLTFTGNEGTDTVHATGNYDTITSGSGTSTITASGSGNTLSAGSGTNTINASGELDTINTGSGTTTVNASGSWATINAGSGTLTINASGSSAIINGGSGDTTINATGNNATIYLGSGSETVDDYGANNTISLGSGTVTLNANGSGTNITAGTGHETVNLYGDNLSFSGSSAIETLTAYGNNDTLSAGSNNATMAASGTNDSLSAGYNTSLIQDSGTNDVIHLESATNIEVDLSGSGTTVVAGAGTESIHLNNDNLTFTGAAGTDTVLATGNNDTITSGWGTSTITASGSGNTLYASGNNTIINASGGTATIYTGSNSTVNASGSSATINAGSDTSTINASGSSATINLTSGDATINATGNNATINGGNSTLTITASGSSATVNAGSGTSTINASGDSATIDGGGGTSTINASGNSATINGGSGTSTINATGDSATIDGGNGTSTINANGNSATINGGSGDATIYATGNNATINVGSGNETVGVTGTSDTMIFGMGSGYEADSLALFMNGNNLEFGTIGSGKTVTINSQTDSSNHVSKFELGNGNYLTDADVSTLIQQISTYATDNSVSLNSLSDVQNNSSVMALVAASWHS